ncbi:MAG: hypothetical protein DI629_20785 [Mesorhizobium amorphae]|nr:MAG: hypothetical protein DI629_20785 [Mesorhizobium amorphae]
MSDVFEDFPALASSGYLFRIVDNGGETADRYTVLFSDGDALGMNAGGIGFSQFVGRVDPAVLQEHVESGHVDVGPDDLDEATRAHILNRVNGFFRETVDAMEAQPPGREDAELNDGTWECAGTGVYKAGEEWFVAIEENEDRGPFGSAAEAIRASLPDACSLSGPEYQSAHFPTSAGSEASPDPS